MKFHRSTVAALAASMFLTLFAADGSGANAETSAIPSPTVVQPTPETVPPAPVQVVSEEVVQPLSSTPTKIDRPDAGSLRELVAAMPRDAALSREMECLAGAIYFESRGEPLAGQLGVAEVIINRSESGRFPSDYCGVVYQRSQFSFVRGGRMPRIDRGSTAWRNATAIARIAHEGLWDSAADSALYFHARSVRPGWSHTKVALATISSHVFYK